MVTDVSTNSNNQANPGTYGVAKIAGNGFAYASLSCSAFFWINFAFYYVPGAPKLNLTGFDWFRIMAVAVILSGASVACRAKPWKLALPVALVMFFFVMYVMGT
jgi:hypothetical protein